MHQHVSRRRLVGGLAGAAGLTVSGAPLSLTRALTPSASTGPFYPHQYPADQDHDLTAVAGIGKRADGRHVYLRGTVTDATGRPYKSARVEIWQCDANGRYHHPRDAAGAALDPAFQGWGKYTTGVDGIYQFRTILPVPYPGRTPHIHFLIQAGSRRLVTQMYLRGARGNQSDGLFNNIPVTQRDQVLVEFNEGDGELPVGHFDIVIA